MHSAYSSYNTQRLATLYTYVARDKRGGLQLKIAIIISALRTRARRMILNLRFSRNNFNFDNLNNSAYVAPSANTIRCVCNSRMSIVVARLKTCKLAPQKTAGIKKKKKKEERKKKRGERGNSIPFCRALNVRIINFRVFQSREGEKEGVRERAPISFFFYRSRYP
ncbi:hypothetical protein PUN28_003089 [Cardiocondyla obscurior]|uniref:Uncharacterized protein n=1 Tax=Cardiocondyla obscurior TaxID=286306 RepID=A0AAW2GJ02_9HYME